jgi:DNA-binding NtrC family response regulator
MSMMSSHTARVLVVDDDDARLDLIGSVLSEAGFDVSTAPTALTALELLAEGVFDIVVTEVDLAGGLNGVELVKCARAQQPSLRSLFISGRTGPYAVVDEPDRDDFIGVPFRNSELVGCVWELLFRDLPKKQLSKPSRQAELCILQAKLTRLRGECPERKGSADIRSADPVNWQVEP